MFKPHDAMLAVAGIEEHCIKLRKLTCEGSFLIGHTVNHEQAALNRIDARDELIGIILKATRAIEYLGENPGE